ncbi:hypothetical protein HBH77_110390 [Parastagonospora nodorum]|nr:hypothetical protein HBH50_158720 [Parastagonospora nodorum]KAH4092092.1 hypothetical protein HBH48_081780 [Parastagonospora nodorum]KAH4174183.1 hypothetical protein HBH43_072870 [Parastagonospora nodorum]KAH5204049.1 hypothetical protein HBH77_110390 [Parastagonospora nodorum]KAH5647583.1 hypothetical protein HBI51_102250 [Parastagonospora nodorum]
MWKSEWRFFPTKVPYKSGRRGNNVYFIPGPLRHVSLGCHSHANSPRPASPLCISHNWYLNIQSVDVLTARVPIIVRNLPIADVKQCWYLIGRMRLSSMHGRHAGFCLWRWITELGWRITVADNREGNLAKCARGPVLTIVGSVQHGRRREVGIEVLQWTNSNTL